MKTAVTFYSEGHMLVGDVYMPDDIQPGEQRAGVLLCHGYTGVKDLYLPDNARMLNEAGYAYPFTGGSQGLNELPLPIVLRCYCR